jgi:cytosine/adenosine deaminase-related metal-dependent hydrolase
VGFRIASSPLKAGREKQDRRNRLDTLGTVEPGKLADLVLLDADPLKDIHNTTKISEVFLGGKEFDRATLDHMLDKTR